jgi:hypothetical protein
MLRKTETSDWAKPAATRLVALDRALTYITQLVVIHQSVL